jgi:hypothetical protein
MVSRRRNVKHLALNGLRGGNLVTYFMETKNLTGGIDLNYLEDDGWGFCENRSIYDR